LPRQTESTDQDRTLPLPELNPLINPLLGQHMGRWAEVYFTAAPEHREEAVLALLRELESGNAAKPAETVSKTTPVRIQFADENAPPVKQFVPRDPGRAPLRPDPIVRKFVVCESCGQSVPETQRFCGMCGAPLRGEADGFNIGNRDNNYQENEESYPIDEKDFQQPAFSFGGNVAASDESVPYRYQIYVGAALVMLIAALVLMAYRGTQDWLGKSHPLPQPAPSDSQPAAQPAAAQPAAKSDVPPPVADNNHAATPAEGKDEPQQESRPGTAPAPAPLAATRNAPSPVSNPSSSSAGSQGNGSEELQVAERYLNGTDGRARDSREAARWLWQAVGKQNATATLLLSDLYIKGDGVPKNCDQARLLLDAAARKGAPGAGTRIRYFQAFGCP
jgi:hypothetical protein